MAICCNGLTINKLLASNQFVVETGPMRTAVFAYPLPEMGECDMEHPAL